MFSSCKAAVLKLSCFPPKSRHSGFSQGDHNSVVRHSGGELHVMVMEDRSIGVLYSFSCRFRFAVEPVLSRH